MIANEAILDSSRTTASANLPDLPVDASEVHSAKTDSADKLPIMGIDLDFVYLYAGAPERAIEGYERKADVGFFGGNQMAYVWHPSFAAVRKTERFKALMRKAGLVALWRAEGWPEPCHPTAADDFECE